MWLDEHQKDLNKIKRTPGSKLVALKTKRLNIYQNLSLVKDHDTNKTWWRHRYHISVGSNLHPKGDFEDFPREQFKNINAFAKFITEQTPKDGQYLPSGKYTVKTANKNIQANVKNRKDY